MASGPSHANLRRRGVHRCLRPSERPADHVADLFVDRPRVLRGVLEHDCSRRSGLIQGTHDGTTATHPLTSALGWTRRPNLCVNPTIEPNMTDKLDASGF